MLSMVILSFRLLVLGEVIKTHVLYSLPNPTKKQNNK